jgi:hypothetical protein
MPQLVVPVMHNVTRTRRSPPRCCATGFLVTAEVTGGLLPLAALLDRTIDALRQSLKREGEEPDAADRPSSRGTLTSPTP